MDLSQFLAEKIIQFKYQDLPQEVVSSVKKGIIDSLGVLVAGSSAPGCPQVIELLRHWGGKEESSVLVFGIKIPSLWAAYANAMMSHARDFDDTHDRAVLHAYCATLYPALALAEQKGEVRGQSLILAVALGAEVSTRLALSLGAVGGWHRTGTCGAFGATVAAGKMTGLDASQMQNALGIAYSQIAGNRQAPLDGALTKRLSPAHAAKVGVLSSLFAARGITGAKDTFEGRYGFFRLYERGKAEEVLPGWGERFEVLNLSLKPYPSCRATHGGIDAALALAGEKEFDPSAVEEVKVFVPRSNYSFDIVSRPFAIKGNPQVDAQFSIPYTVAASLHRRSLFLEDFEEARITDPKVLALAQKVKVETDEKTISPGMAPIAVEVKFKGGDVLKKRVEALKGSPENPLSLEECLVKFERCLTHGAQPISPEKVKEAKNLLGKLEELDTLAPLLRCFCAGKENHVERN